jgi:dihydropteroate synthase
VFDPGIGFGKTIIDNDIIINRLNDLKKLGFPLLIGLSRKSFLSIDEDEAEDRLPATLGVTALALQNGADIIRVHDVEETYRMLTVTCRVLSTNKKKILSTYEI